MWFRRDGDSLLFSTTAARQKARNVARGPRVSVTVFDLDNPYDSVEIRGRAEVLDDAPRALPRELSQRYLDEDPPPEPPDVRRLIVRVVPEKVNRFRA
jgi:PPOX class probable F420-dependent enzyme